MNVNLNVVDGTSLRLPMRTIINFYMSQIQFFSAIGAGMRFRNEDVLKYSLTALYHMRYNRICVRVAQKGESLQKSFMLNVGK